LTEEQERGQARHVRLGDELSHHAREAEVDENRPVGDSEGLPGIDDRALGPELKAEAPWRSVLRDAVLPSRTRLTTAMMYLMARPRFERPAHADSFTGDNATQRSSVREARSGALADLGIRRTCASSWKGLGMAAAVPDRTSISRAA
jgi:hypothetical protein